MKIRNFSWTPFSSWMQRRSPLSLPAILKNRHIYILPTRSGVIFLLVLFAMCMGSINYNNNMGFLLTFLLGSMAFVSILHSHKNIRGLAMEAVESKPVFAGQPALFTFTVHGGGRKRESFYLAIEDNFSRSNDVDKASSRDIAVPVFTQSRGILRFPSFRIVSEYPLGLFKTWSHVYIPLECMVYPAPLATETIRQQGTAQQGNEEGSGPGSDDFKTIRTYQPGDPLKRIAWKSSFRGHGLMTKEFQGSGRRSIWFDYALFSDDDTEIILSKLCYLVLQAHEGGLLYGLRMPHKEIPPAHDELHLQDCLASLALYGVENE